MDVSICGQLSSMEAISHNAVGVRSVGEETAVGKRTNSLALHSAPLFKFTLCTECIAPLAAGVGRETAGGEENREESVQQQQRRALVINDVFESMHPPSARLLFFFQCERRRKVCHCHCTHCRRSLPFSLSKAVCATVESICATKDRDPCPKWGPLRLH